MPTGMIAGSLTGAVQQGMGEDAALDTGPKHVFHVSGFSKGLDMMWFLQKVQSGSCSRVVCRMAPNAAF